jgi:Family of unknown function (DUF6518)
MTVLSCSSAVTPVPRSSPRSANERAILRLIATVTVGLAVGVATSMLQKYLDRPWASLANSASPWLAAMFAVGAIWLRPLTAAVAGLGTGLLELVGYYVTSAAKGYSAGGQSVLLFWGACAVVGGPVFGVAGSAWWRSTSRPRRSVAAASLPAAFFSEAVVVYGHFLHYWSSAFLFGALAFSAFILLGIRRRDHANVAAWFLLIAPVGLVAEFLLDLVYREAI